jgi:hypothetical protein
MPFKNKGEDKNKNIFQKYIEQEQRLLSKQNIVPTQ